MEFEKLIKEKTNEELIDIFVNSEQYQATFICLVEAEILKREIPISPLKEIKKKSEDVSDSKLGIGEQGNPLWVGLCFLSALFGGVIAIVAGYVYYTAKTQNSKGEELYCYNDRTRQYGKLMMIVGSIVLFATLYYYIEIA